MGVREIGWRGWRAGLTVSAPALDRRHRRTFPDAAARDRAFAGFVAAEGPGVVLDRRWVEQVRAERPDEVAAVVAAAEDVLAGRVRFFGYPEARLGHPVDWSLDPVAGYDWPLVASGRLDHRTARADAKWIWELNRLQHLPWLAQAWLFTGREEFAEAAAEHLSSWIEQNPVGEGIAWRGAFEAGLRAISVAVALQGLRGSSALTPELFERSVDLLRSSARICWRERSLFSSANNHLLGEMAGLAVVAAVLPRLPESRRWRRRALKVLAREADLQLLPDGSGAEQALAYQVFATELLLLASVVSGPGDGRLDRAVRRSADFLAALVGEGDPAPRYGDDDGGFALRLGAEEVRTVPDHLAVVAAVGATSPPPGGGLLAGWLRAATQGRAPIRPLAPTASSVYAADGGLVVLRDGGQRVLVDVGPLGHLTIAAHGHADALAVTLALDGRAVVDDPGTGSYYGHPEWRPVHRSTRTHATLTVDGEDQSVMAGPFMWSRHAAVRVHEVDLRAGVVDAEHDGYQRLDEPVTHRRRLEAASGDGFVVVDVLHGSGEHRATVSWPLAPDLVARPDALGHVVERDGEPLLQVATAANLPVEHTRVVGDEDTGLGWWSDRLESRVPAYLLTSSVRGPVPLVLATVVRRTGPEGRLRVGDLRVEVSGGQAHVSWTEDGRPVQTTVAIVVTGVADGH